MQEAVKHDPQNLYTYYLLFKIALYKEENDKGKSSVS